MEKMSSIIRREFKKGDDIRDAGLTAPDDVIQYKDIAYGKDSAMQVLDVYRPKDTEGNLPVIVSVHGGGWVNRPLQKDSPRPCHIYLYYQESMQKHCSYLPQVPETDTPVPADK